MLTSTAILARLTSVSASVLVSWRVTIAFIGAFLWVILVRKHKVWLGARQVANLLVVGLIVGLHWLCFFGAVKLANVSVGLIGVATISLFTAFMEPLLMGRRIRLFEIMLSVLVIIGILTIAGAQQEHMLGLMIALLGAFLAALFSVLNRKLVIGGGDPLLMVGWEMLGAALICLVTLPLFDAGGYAALFSPNQLDWLWIFILALVCTVFAHALNIHLLRYLTAYTMNLAFNFEPIYGIIVAAFLFQEHQHLQPAFYLGALFILSANLLHPRLERRAKSKALTDFDG